MINARAVIEGLRSGVPYPETAQAVLVGRQAVLDDTVRLLETVESGHRPKTWGRVWRAEFGDGKTHLLHALAKVAQDRHWVVSWVTLSKETPLDRMDYLYPKLVANTYRPGSHQPGLAEIIAEAMASPQFLAELAEERLSDRLRAVVKSLARRDQGYEELLADIEGEFLSMATIRQHYRKNFQRPFKHAEPSAPSRLRDEVWNYLRFVDFTVGQAGYRGWLILFDEVELIGRFGRGGRAKSYAHLGRWLSGVGERTVTLWAVAGNYETDVLQPRKDRLLAPEWLEGRPREQALAPWARMGLEALANAQTLDPLTSDQIRALLGRIVELHQEAFGWRAPIAPESLYDAVRLRLEQLDPRVRTWVRIGIAILDLLYQYGDSGALSVTPIAAPDLSEEATPHEEV
ncbi:MAG: ATP-binding protein [Firmicutes bacterium]|nr:DUF2791 family P-loop domain-containing protein [Alicyclobacillaceae bacterium]MCL6497551.1 ATP-binding protein [Bacillota bacterium]